MPKSSNPHQSVVYRYDEITVERRLEDGRRVPTYYTITSCRNGVIVRTVQSDPTSFLWLVCLPAPTGGACPPSP